MRSEIDIFQSFLFRLDLKFIVQNSTGSSAHVSHKYGEKSCLSSGTFDCHWGLHLYKLHPVTETSPKGLGSVVATNTPPMRRPRVRWWLHTIGAKNPAWCSSNARLTREHAICNLIVGFESESINIKKLYLCPFSSTQRSWTKSWYDVIL